MLIKHIHIARLCHIPNGFGFRLKNMVQAWVLRLKPSIWVKENNTSFFIEFQNKIFDSLKVDSSVLEKIIEYIHPDFGFDVNYCPPIAEVGKNFPRNFVLLAIY